MKKVFLKYGILKFLFVSLCIVAVPFLLQNCSKKDLNLTNPNELPVAAFWKTADDAEKGLVACYGPLTTIPGWGRMLGAILTIQRGDDANPFASPNVQEAVLQSILGRVSYSYLSKYLLTATLRRDGSSKFLYPTNTFGNYPSFSVGWRVSEEGFFPKNGFISDLKLRGSYGTLGSQNIGNYITTSTLNINASYYFAGGVQNGVALTQFKNPDVKWESSRTTDVGADIQGGW